MMFNVALAMNSISNSRKLVLCFFFPQQKHNETQLLFNYSPNEFALRNSNNNMQFFV